MTAAQKIDKLLKERCLSRRQLAISAKIPPSTLQSALERNKDIPLSMLIKVSEALGVNIYYVLGDEELDHFGGTGFEGLNTAMQIAQEENDLLNSGLSAFMTLNGYSLAILQGEGEGISKTLDAIKHTFSIEKDGKKIKLSLNEMNRLGNEVCDMVGTRLNYLFKEKGGDNG